MAKPFQENDIGLIFLGDAEQLAALNPVVYNRSNIRLRKGNKALAFGTGRLSSFGSIKNPDMLKKVELTLANRSSCEKGFKTISPLLQLKKSHLCTYEDSGGIDTCQGDSGGPLIISNTILGVTRLDSGVGKKIKELHLRTLKNTVNGSKRKFLATD